MNMKKMMYFTVLGAGMLLLPLALSAQSANPVSTALKSALRAATSRMVASAQLMPADKYSFKPTPESMSFGQLILHVGNSNDAMCQWVSGAAPAPKTTLTATSPKDELIEFLKKSFAYCDQSFQNVDDSKLGSMVPAFGGRKITQAQLMFTLTGDWEDHYSQQAAYLRLNGILPPTARRSRGRGGR